jgi:hypothetical protein
MTSVAAKTLRLLKSMSIVALAPLAQRSSADRAAVTTQAISCLFIGFPQLPDRLV